MPPDYLEEEFIPFLLKHNTLIYDLYFTSRMPPFAQDAMGDVFTSSKSAQDAVKNALYISEKTQIPLSATFNNIWVRPDQKNLDEFIKNFKFLYDNGVRTATIPHTSWVMTGQLKKEFPELKIKNTILRDVIKPNEIVTLASAGFNYINLDRDIMRDQDAFEMLLKAKDYCANKGTPIELSLLANEHCWGGCPIMPEHYQYNATRKGTEPAYFSSEISRVSCSRWDAYDPASELKSANLPPWRSDWQWFLDNGIDVFKMHGREDAMRLKESMDLVERWANHETLMYPEYQKYLNDVDIKEKPIDIWRDKIKTCKFNCWDCNYCETVVESHLKKQQRKMNPLVDHVIRSIDGAVDNNSKFDPVGYDIVGLSSNKVRHLLNNLCSERGTVYADVGCYVGSTVFAALMNNESVKAYAIDDFSDGLIVPKRKDLFEDFERITNPVDTFIKNTEKWMNLNCSAVLSLKSIQEINFNTEYRPSVIFYDAEIEDNMVANLEHLHNEAQDNYILVIDDANFQTCTDNAEKFLSDKNVLFKRIITTEIPEDANDWWNGVVIAVIDKINRNEEE